MITLKTLPKATAQDVFNQVRDHLLAQGERSVRPQDTQEEAVCQYRSGAMRCAAGCLIADDEYSVAMEIKGWARLSNEGLVPVAHIRLICALQDMHDKMDPEHWRERMNEIAGQLGLEP